MSCWEYNALNVALSSWSAAFVMSSKLIFNISITDLHYLLYPILFNVQQETFFGGNCFSKRETDGWHHCQTAIIVRLLALNHHLQSLLFSRSVSTIRLIVVHLIILCQLHFNPWHELIYRILCSNDWLHFWPHAKTTLISNSHLYGVLEIINGFAWETPLFTSLGAHNKQSLKSTWYFYGKVTDKIRQRFVWSTITRNILRM